MRYLVWHAPGGSLIFPAENDAEVEEASLAVLAHMNNRAMLASFDPQQREAAVHLLGLDVDTPVEDRPHVSPSVTATTLLDKVVSPATGRVEFTEI